MRACSLQGSRPLDVRLFVEPSLELYERDDLLAHLRGAPQGQHVEAIDGRAIEGVFDREHVGVGRGRLDERHDRGHE